MAWSDRLVSGCLVAYIVYTMHEVSDWLSTYGEVLRDYTSWDWAIWETGSIVFYLFCNFSSDLLRA